MLEYQSDPIYNRYNSWDERTERTVKEFVGRFIQWQREKPRTRFQLAIDLKSERRLIGNCGIRSNAQLAEAELGFELDRAYWDRGYASEAAGAMLRFAFLKLGLGLVRAHCVSENVASAGVLRKIGMRHVRTEPSSIWMKGQWWSTEHFEITRKEWEGV